MFMGGFFYDVLCVPGDKVGPQFITSEDVIPPIDTE